MTPIRVLLADDHPVLRAGLRAVIDAQPDLRVVAEAGDGPAAVLAAPSADVVLLDLNMPGGGAAVIPQILAGTRARVLVLTMHTDPAYRRATEQAGAVGYLLKTAAMPELLAAVRAVAVGGTAFDPLPEPAVTAELSRREKEVLEYLVHGHTHQVIADKLNVSVKTVETYRARIREKTGLKTRADLVRHGLATGLLTADPGEQSTGERPA
jgi:DNA-binding NarL/FixJ family response regulator